MGSYSRAKFLSSYQKRGSAANLTTFFARHVSDAAPRWDAPPHAALGNPELATPAALRAFCRPLQRRVKQPAGADAARLDGLTDGAAPV